MKTSFDHIAAIYNPNSTNDAAGKAKCFQATAKKHGISVTLTPTTHAGHASEIASKLIGKYHTPLLVSVSGDGGYNELINGVMRAKSGTSKQPVVAIIAAGNANDHKRLTRGKTSLLTLIKQADPKPLDLLALRTKSVDRYAHSYIGLGITPEVGIELNRHSLTWTKEIQLVFKSFRKFKPFTIERNGVMIRCANLLFANVSGMSKIIKLDPTNNKLDDGQFEVIIEPWHSKLMLLLHLLKLVIVGSPASPQYQTYKFTTVDSSTPVQLDGEIEYITAGTEVIISAEPNAILSLYEPA